MTTEPQRFQEIIAAVTEGKPVDWAEAEERATTQDERRWIASLREVAAVAQAHRADVEAAPRGAAVSVGRYTLVEESGRGGMGLVWRARDTSLQREVALKFLHSDLAGRHEFRERFLREARAAAALSHPNICTTHEVGETAEVVELAGAHGPESIPARTPYIAMELLTGPTLADVLRDRGSLGLGDLLGVAEQTAEGLLAAHQKGIIHRDLKPGNVMLSGNGTVKLLDFGLARVLESPEDSPPAALDGGHTTQLTVAGKLMGTVSYMSPEQAKGKPAGAASDLFSFGTMLHELATGRRPFQGDEPISTIAKILEHEPGPITAVRDDLPDRLDHVVKRCLRKNPDERYRDTAELLSALRELREGVASGAVAARRSGGIRSWPRRVWAAAAATLLLAASILGVMATRRPAVEAVPSQVAAEDVVVPAGEARGVSGTNLPEFFDGFDVAPRPAASGPWEILGFDPSSWNPSVRPGYLTLWTHLGDLWLKRGEDVPVRNIVAFPFSASGFQATTLLVGFSPTREPQQAGLVVLADQDNYCRLTMGPPSSAVSKTRTFQVVIERRGEVLEMYGQDLVRPIGSGIVAQGLASLHLNAGEETVWLRISRDGDQWSARYSLDGVRFALVREWRIPLETRYVGLAAFHGVSDREGRPLTHEPIPAHFDFLRIEPYP